MKNIMVASSFLIAMGLCSPSALAALYDLDADTNERAGGDGSDNKEIWYDGGDFKLSAYNFVTPTSPYTDAEKIYAYLDNTGGQDGGGACQTNNCAGSSDDNLSRVTKDEMLALDLTNGTVFGELSLWGDHQDYVPSFVRIDIDGFGTGADFANYAVSYRIGGEAFVDLAAIGVGDSFLITTLDTTASSQLYLSSVSSVPVPAAAWLFGSALIGLAGISRRRAAKL